MYVYIYVNVYIYIYVYIALIQSYLIQFISLTNHVRSKSDHPMEKTSENPHCTATVRSQYVVERAQKRAANELKAVVR